MVKSAFKVVKMVKMLKPLGTSGPDHLPLTRPRLGPIAPRSTRPRRASALAR